MVVPGTLEVGLVSLAKELRRVVLPVLGKPTSWMRLIWLFSMCSYRVLMPALLTLLVSMIFIPFIL